MTMFFIKMARHTGNDKFLIHCFQDILIGFVVRWYMKLDHDQIYTWTNLEKAFLAQYDHVVDTSPDLKSLMTMVMKETKTFKDYAQRW